MRRGIVFALWLSACEKEVPPDDDGPPGSVCGDPIHGLTMDVSGVVRDARGAPAVGAEVEFEDRSVQPAATLGETTTLAGGTFLLHATDITVWPDCWLTLASFGVAAELGDAEGELGWDIVNRRLWEAFQDDATLLDLSDEPITLR